MTSDRSDVTPAASPAEPAALPWHPKSSRSMTAVITLALVTCAGALYLSPAGDLVTGGERAAGAAAVTPRSTAPKPLAPTKPATPSRSGLPRSAKPAKPASSAPSTPSPAAPVHPVVRRTPGNTQIDYVPTGGDGVAPVSGTGSTKKPIKKPVKKPVKKAAKPKKVWCTDFKFQQDAQAAYVANLSDPHGLDGAPGPHNGDGLACTQLPVDTTRARSTAVDAYVPPSPASASSLARPKAKYFGIAQDGLPGDTAQFDAVAAQVGKTPSSVSWFDYFDQSYEADKVQAAWSHGALPVITWMTMSSSKSDPNLGKYTLASIVAGKWDKYLLKYAGAILKTNLPVALRWDHEMNGNWMPWSAGLPANQGAPGQPNLYVQAWRHIHDLFDTVGANENVIWMWSPVRVDNIRPHSPTPGWKYETTLEEDYPGDEYVDWNGMTAYQYKPSDGWTYAATFKATLDGLRAVADKPIYVAETGATQAVGTTDYSAEKAQWIKQMLSGLAAEPDVVGLSYFNNSVDGAHFVNGKPIVTDWRYTSSPEALAAFKDGIDNDAYSSGVLPDTLKVS